MVVELPEVVLHVAAVELLTLRHDLDQLRTDRRRGTTKSERRSLRGRLLPGSLPAPARTRVLVELVLVAELLDELLAARTARVLTLASRQQVKETRRGSSVPPPMGSGRRGDLIPPPSSRP